jgi:hypothetical protein
MRIRGCGRAWKQATFPDSIARPDIYDHDLI